MATLVLATAGAAIGGAVGGSVAGLSAAVIGRAAGAALGRSIDQRILGAGSDPVDVGRRDRFRLTGAGEGVPWQQVYGRMRIGGHVIWASNFREHVTTSGGGKGTPSRPKTREHSYSVSLAIGLCHGVITRVGRVWADGVEIARDDLNLRVYRGTHDQAPDPCIEAIEGAGNVPGYQGLAYVVIEDLDLTPFGNRVPQFSFEVHRPAQAGEHADLASSVQGVAMIPGSGEYALATSAVAINAGFGDTRIINRNTPSGQTDFVESVGMLEEELPRCNAVSLVVSWFGDDLRAGSCRVRPMVEHKGDDADMPWSVGDATRETAAVVPYENARPVYGGTPADAAVKQAIADLNSRGKDVMFYPFVLMTQLSGNALFNPWGGVGQPALPWRGRITTSLAPGVEGSPDGTATARDEVTLFFNRADGFRAFILHYAQLCADAGGVSAFCIGSELRGVTTIRDDVGYPAVDELRRLAADVRAILGPNCKISYAADWSEYHGHQPGGGDKVFHLDPLWADDNIDFVGIDNYMPLSDWRDGHDHADAGWGDVHNLAYLQSNVAGGELFDWYYVTEADRDAQNRTPITDGAGEPWIWRAKDLQGWWGNAHHNRVGGVRSETPTDWVPGMKPICFTEYGCAAIDRGTNQPNKFLDPKSSESSLPYYSGGFRDDYIQMKYIQAVNAHFENAENNPVSELTGQRMVDMGRAHVWAWDARPWPAFPGRDDLWSDGANYDRGHWINGRASAVSLAAVVREICARAGVADVDTDGLHGLVRGYAHDDTATGREALQPLMLAYGFDMVERDGMLVFRSRTNAPGVPVAPDDLAVGEDGSAAPEFHRDGQGDVPDRVRVGFIRNDSSYDSRMAEASLPGAHMQGVAGSDLPLVLSGAEAQAVAERWMMEGQASRDQVRLALPPSSPLAAGDIVHLQGHHWRIDRVDSAGVKLVEAVRMEPAMYQPHEGASDPVHLPVQTPAGPVEALFLELPPIRGDEAPHAPHVAMVAKHWPGQVMMHAAVDDAGYEAVAVFDGPAIAGVSETVMAKSTPDNWDDGPALRVRLNSGALSSATEAQVLAGANMAAIGDGTPANWEVFQFAEAELIEPGVFDLRHRKRGLLGTDKDMPNMWPIGSRIVLLDHRVRQIDMPPILRGIARDYRWGPASRPMGDNATWRHVRLAFDGVDLPSETPVGVVDQNYVLHITVDGETVRTETP